MNNQDDIWLPKAFHDLAQERDNLKEQLQKMEEANRELESIKIALLETINELENHIERIKARGGE